MKRLKLTLVVLAAGLGLLSQVHAAGLKTAFRLLSEAVQAGHHVIDGVPGSGPLVENFGNKLKAMGLPENATREQFFARLGELNLSETARTRLLANLDSTSLTGDNAGELLASMGEVSPGFDAGLRRREKGAGCRHLFPLCELCGRGRSGKTHPRPIAPPRGSKDGRRDQFVQ